VRTAKELAQARLDPVLHIPLHELPNRVAELEPYRDIPIVCLCHHGIRSAMAVRVLRERGFKDVHNLTGGIDAYARGVDATVPLY
jgi:rhodanese-related sulfurtransferase